MLRIRIIIRSAREPDMEPPDHPQGAVHQHAACGLESIQAITRPCDSNTFPVAGIHNKVDGIIFMLNYTSYKNDFSNVRFGTFGILHSLKQTNHSDITNNSHPLFFDTYVRS